MPPAIEKQAPRSPLPGIVWRLGWVSFATDAATEMIYPLLPAFLEQLSGGAVALGLMEGIAESVAAVLKWWSGRASDRAPTRKPFVVAGYALASVVRPLLAFATLPWHVIAIRATDRVGKGIRSAPRDALLGASVPPERHAEAFGVHQMMDNLGAVVGPLMALAFVWGLHAKLTTVFAFSLVPGLVATAIVLSVREAPPDVSSGKEVPTVAEEAPLPRAAKRFLGVVFLFTLGSSADSFLLLRLVDLKLDAAWLPLVWLTLSAAKAASNIPGGRFSDRRGHRRALMLGWLLYAAVYAAFPLATSIPLAWGLLIVYGGYYGLTEGGTKALLGEVATGAGKGRAFGALHAVTGLAVLPANALFGALYRYHATAAFWTSGACALAAALLLPWTRAGSEESFSVRGKAG